KKEENIFPDNKPINHNYIILLDLSDRIIAHKDQIHRDKAVINTIFQCFKAKAKESYYIKSSDQFKVLIAEQISMPVDILKFEDKLRLNLGNLPVSKKKSELDKLEGQLGEILNELYADASFYQNSNEFKGAQIWKYFNEGLETEIIHGDSENY